MVFVLQFLSTLTCLSIALHAQILKISAFTCCSLTTLTNTVGQSQLERIACACKQQPTTWLSHSDAAFQLPVSGYKRLCKPYAAFSGVYRLGTRLNAAYRRRASTLLLEPPFKHRQLKVSTDPFSQTISTLLGYLRQLLPVSRHAVEGGVL